MSRPYRGRGRGRGNDRFGYGRERRHPYEQEYARDREFVDRAGFRRDDVREFRRDGSRGPRDGPRDGPREPPREPRPWESRDRPPPRDPRDHRDARDRDPRDRDPRERDPRDSPRGEFRDRERPPSGPRERHDSHSSSHSGRPPPREPRGEFHRQPERDKDSPSRPHGPKLPSSGNGSRHNNTHNSSTPTTPVVGTPKAHVNHMYQEAHFHLGSEATVSRASEPYHITTAQTEGLQKRLNELEAFNQALDILDAKRRKLEGEYASIETDVVREGVRAEETGRALEALNAHA